MPYRSQGTVSIYTDRQNAWINFVPSGNYLVKHGGRSYAIFLPDDDNDERCIRKPCQDKDGTATGIRIELHDEGQAPKVADLQMLQMLVWTGAQSATMTHSKVKVEVTIPNSLKKEKNTLKLTGIPTLAQ